MKQAMFTGEILVRTFQMFLQRTVEHFLIVFVNAVCPKFNVFNRRFHVLTQHDFPTVGEIDFPRGQVPIPNSVIGSFDRKLEPVFTFPEGIFRLSSFNRNAENIRHRFE